MTDIREARITGFRVDLIPTGIPRMQVAMETRRLIVDVGLVLNGRVVGSLKEGMATALRLQDDADIEKALADLLAVMNRKATEKLFGTNFTEVPLAAEPPTNERR
jgi:hypothetical protein